MSEAITLERPTLASARVTVRNLRGKGSVTFTVYGRGDFNAIAKQLMAACEPKHGKAGRDRETTDQR